MGGGSLSEVVGRKPNWTALEEGALGATLGLGFGSGGVRILYRRFGMAAGPEERT